MMKSSGYSLVELMVSLLLSSLVIAILMRSVCWLQQQTEWTLDEIKRVQEKTWIVSFLRSRVHAAGFTPCRSLDNLELLDTREKIRTLKAIELRETNHITLRHMGYAYAEVYALDEQRMRLSIQGISIDPERPIIIADCFHAEIHEIESIQKQADVTSIVLKKPVFYRYQLPFYLGEWIVESFFIKNQTLFYHYQHTDALADWIHNMSISVTQEAYSRRLQFTFGKDLSFSVRGRNA
jgi:hypothetical protein